MAVLPKGLPLMAEWDIHPAKDRALGWGLGAIPQGAAPAQPFREDIPALMISSTRRMLLAITVLENRKEILLQLPNPASLLCSKTSPCTWDPQFYITWTHTEEGQKWNSASLTMNEAAAF